MPNSLERSILATLLYFDLFSYPLTTFELWKWLEVEPGDSVPTLSKVASALAESPMLASRIEEHEGMYFLRGCVSNVAIRKERYLLAEKKYQRLLGALRIFRALPFIRAIAVCNSLAYSNARDESDLDLLVIAEPGRIWTARMFATGLAALLKWRPMPGMTRNTICLSFYVTTDVGVMQGLTLSQHDLYFRHWLDQLVPVLGEARLLDDLREANSWYHDRLPNAFGTSSSWRRFVADSSLKRGVRKALEFVHKKRMGDWLEARYRRLQERRLPDKLRRLANRDTRVVLNDRMLKFHENDRRQEFVERHAARVQEALAA